MVKVIAVLSVLLLPVTAPVALAQDDCDAVQIDAGECELEASDQDEAAADEASDDADWVAENSDSPDEDESLVDDAEEIDEPDDQSVEDSATSSDDSVAGEEAESEGESDAGDSVEDEVGSVGDPPSKPESNVPPPVATPVPQPAPSAPAPAAPAPSSGTKLYVGNLAFSATDEKLRASFGEFGTVVSAKVVMDPTTGRPKGIAFVEMGTPEQAAAAIRGLNGQAIDGRALVVNAARPK